MNQNIQSNLIRRGVEREGARKRKVVVADRGLIRVTASLGSHYVRVSVCIWSRIAVRVRVGVEDGGRAGVVKMVHPTLTLTSTLTSTV